VIWLVQLVFDCADPDAVTQCWGTALGYRNPHVGAPAEEVAAFRRDHPEFDGRGRIDDDELRRMPVYLQRVPEPKVGRNRLRPELTVGSAAEGQALTQRFDRGDAEGEWRDVEGNELTVRIDEGGGPTRLRSIVIDSLDPERLVHFWSEATGYRRDGLRCDPSPRDLRWTGTHFEVGAAGGAAVRHVTGSGGTPGPAPYDLVPGLAFVPTDEPKARKNRLHLDLCSTAVEEDRARLVALGAEVVRWDTDHVLVDPEGNELCLGGRPG
jgi:hypothetical protein